MWNVNHALFSFYTMHMGFMCIHTYTRTHSQNFELAHTNTLTTKTVQCVCCWFRIWEILGIRSLMMPTVAAASSNFSKLLREIMQILFSIHSMNHRYRKTVFFPSILFENLERMRIFWLKFVVTDERFIYFPFSID